MTTGTFTAVGQASDSFQLTTGAGVQLVPDGAASAALIEAEPIESEIVVAK